MLEVSFEVVYFQFKVKRETNILGEAGHTSITFTFSTSSKGIYGQRFI